MKKKLPLVQKEFVLDRKMVPIYRSEGPQMGSYHFVCPLPKGYKRSLTNIVLIKKECDSIIEKLNQRATEKLHPFENILSEYDNREEKRKDIKIGMVLIDSRGVYGVWAGSDVNSGDVYLSTDSTYYYDFEAAKKFRDFFEKKGAFHCHNMDYYWQAILTQEFCIAYFNFLNSIICSETQSLIL